MAKFKVFVTGVTNTKTLRPLYQYFSKIAKGKIRVCSPPQKQRDVSQQRKPYCIIVVWNEEDFELILSQSNYQVDGDQIKVSEYKRKGKTPRGAGNSPIQQEQRRAGFGFSEEAEDGRGSSRGIASREEEEEEANKVFLYNVPRYWDEEELEYQMEVYGEVAGSRILDQPPRGDRSDGGSQRGSERRIAHLWFARAVDAEDAIQSRYLKIGRHKLKIYPFISSRANRGAQMSSEVDLGPRRVFEASREDKENRDPSPNSQKEIEVEEASPIPVSGQQEEDNHSGGLPSLHEQEQPQAPLKRKNTGTQKKNSEVVSNQVQETELSRLGLICSARKNNHYYWNLRINNRGVVPTRKQQFFNQLYNNHLRNFHM